MTTVRIHPVGSYIDAGDMQFPPGADSTGGATTGDIWRGKTVRYAVANNGSSLLNGFGCSFTNTGGSSASGTLSGGGAFMVTLPRITFSTGSGSSGLTSGTNDSVTAYWLGDASGRGGFRVEALWGLVTTRLNMRFAVGMGSANLNAGATDPSAANTDCVFVGYDAGDGNLQVMHNDSAGTCTKVDLGASFARADAMVIRSVFSCSPNASAIDYTITRLDSAATATGTLSTNLPTNTAFMLQSFRFGTGTQTSQVVGAVMSFLGESYGYSGT